MRATLPPERPSLVPCATQLTQTTHHCPSSPKSPCVQRGSKWYPQGPSWYSCILSKFQETGLLPCVVSREPLICVSEMVLSQCGRRKALVRGMGEHRPLTAECPWTGESESIFVVLRFPSLPSRCNLNPPCFPENRADRDSCVLAMTKDV